MTSIDTDTDTKEAQESLRAAFDDLISDLQAARDTIDDPKYFPPELTRRNLAEGYRYLAGFVHHGLERSFYEDPDFPAFRNALSMFNKSTIENSDAIYFYSPIDGRKTYRITGRAEDARHWRGEPRLENAPIAPQYLIFETATGPMAGDTGNISELVPGYRTGFGTLDSSSLNVAADGSFELILGPDKPEGFEGHFICTKKPPNRRNPDGDDRERLIETLDYLFDKRLEESGVWRERLDGDNESIVDYMPGSSPYHLLLGLAEAVRVLG